MTQRRTSPAGWWREPREAWGLLLRRPLWAIVAAGTLAVGMAAFAAAASVADALFLSALPGVGHPGGLLRPSLPDGASYVELSALAAGEVRSLRDVAGFADQIVTVDPGGAGGGGRLLAVLASERYFEVLGVRMARGRAWTAGESAAGAPVAVVGNHYWQRRLGGDPAVIGRVLRVQGEPFTIIGVAPPGFVGTFRGFGFDLWLPLASAPRVAPALDLSDPTLRRLELLARLAPGASRATAEAELRAAARRLRTGEERAAEVLPLTGFDEEIRQPALVLVGVLFALALLVLLVTVANVAGVLVTRALLRRRELAVRAALGASRARLVRLLFWESLLIAGGGAMLGAIGAALLGRGLAATVSALPARVALDLVPGPLALLALAGVAGACALLLAGLAARGAGGRSLAALRETRAGDASPRRLRSALVIGQVAAASALLLLAGILLQSLRTSDRGPALTAVLAAPFLDRVSLRLDETAARELLREIEARVAAVPGVAAAALADRAPVPGGQPLEVLPGPGIERGRAGALAHLTRVSAGYFAVLGLGWRQGRWLNDRADGPEEVVLDVALASRLWPGQPAIGRSLRVGDELLTVAGVVEDLPGPTGAPRPTLYRGLLRQPPVRFALLARAAAGAEPGRVAAAVRGELARTTPGLGPVELSPLRALRRLALLPQRLAASAGSLLGAVGLLVAAVGLYALLTLVIAQGRRELAVRAALGARPGELLRAVLGRALALVAAGYALGVAAALAGSRLLPSASAGLGAGVFLGVGSVLLLTAVAAGAVPALRAWRVDPARALREE